MKTKHKTKTENGLMKGVFMAYFILVLHVVLLGGMGCMVLFFRGFVQYMPWIFVAFGAVITFSGYRILKRLHAERRSLRDLLRLPEYAGKNIEISFLGGVASFKVGDSPPPSRQMITQAPSQSAPQTVSRTESIAPPIKEEPENVEMKRLMELARLYENQLITLEEYERAKHQLLNMP